MARPPARAPYLLLPAVRAAGSMIFAAQRLRGGGSAIPLFAGGGVVFRPLHTKVRCAAGGDCGGHCSQGNPFGDFW